jgi:hypothetical protein
MASRIGKIHVNYSEYCYFDYLEGAEKMNYFFQLFEGVSGKTQMDLSGFFTQINEEYNQEDMEPVVRLKKDVPEDQDRVDIMIDEEFIMIESDSLKAIRLVSTRFMEAGYLLRRDKQSERMFKQDKTTRYLRVYSIIGQEPGFSLS